MYQVNDLAAFYKVKIFTMFYIVSQCNYLNHMVVFMILSESVAKVLCTLLLQPGMLEWFPISAALKLPCEAKSVFVFVYLSHTLGLYTCCSHPIILKPAAEW